ncbi:DUF4870 family protein [Teichococcus aestuarii]|uniref:DUF4870 domain-containing protein n=1 Tax=Teichococcus aestuarii TaxID=568898 RepID=A0A2U1V2E6_9PROT|nr:hypothetical protein [Pseudoroseomonas aestuarii]PWC28066.1 hypothetical protein CR165_14020 [Pseudoroseomonas aestuarii]
MDPVTPQPREADSRLRNVALAVHGLYAASFLLGVTVLVGVVLAYMKRADAAGTIYHSHLTYAIRTFWIGLALSVVSFVLSFVGLGFLLGFFALVWFVIRLVRAFLAWNDRRAVERPERFF